jgi:Tfp pilus assembly protein PilV
MDAAIRQRGWSPARRLRAGLQLIEVLIAGSIMAVSLAAIVSLFAFAFNITRQNDDKSVAYNIARQELEHIRFEGFSNALIVRNDDGSVQSKFQDGTRTTFYDTAGKALLNNSGAAYSAVLVVTSNQLDVVTGGGTRPSEDAKRTVIVTVRRLSDNSVVHQDGTMMVRSGV